MIIQSRRSVINDGTVSEDVLVLRDHLDCLTFLIVQEATQGEVVDIECVHQPIVQSSSAINLEVFEMENSINNPLLDSESIQNINICQGLPGIHVHLRDMTLNEVKDIIRINGRMMAILVVVEDL